jgi:hypothetical protein
LRRAEIRFVLVGGLAVNAWGYLRATRDVEIVPDPEPDNLTRLADLLVTLNGRVELEEGALRPDAIATFLRAGERTLVSTDLGQLDVLQGLPQVPPFAELAKDAQEANVGDLQIRVCSLDALLAMKRASERARDREDLDALEAGSS